MILCYAVSMNKKQKYKNKIAILESLLWKMERDGEESTPRYAQVQEELQGWEDCLADLERDESLPCL